MVRLSRWQKRLARRTFFFGLTADQVANSREWYSPYWHYENEPETRAALDLIFSNHFSRHEPGLFVPLRETLLTFGDHYMHLADLTSYLHAHQRAVELYSDADAWARTAIAMWQGLGNFPATTRLRSMQPKSGRSNHVPSRRKHVRKNGSQWAESVDNETAS